MKEQMLRCVIGVQNKIKEVIQPTEILTLKTMAEKPMWILGLK